MNNKTTEDWVQFWSDQVVLGGYCCCCHSNILICISWY